MTECMSNRSDEVWWKTWEERKRRKTLSHNKPCKEVWLCGSSFRFSYQSCRTACKWWHCSMSSFFRALRSQKFEQFDQPLNFSDFQCRHPSSFCPACDQVLLSSWLLPSLISLTLYGSRWFYFELPNRSLFQSWYWDFPNLVIVTC